MESSPAHVRARTLVLLICLAVVPMAALFGTPPQRRPVPAPPPHETRREGLEAVGAVSAIPESVPSGESRTGLGISTATPVIPTPVVPPRPPEKNHSSRQPSAASPQERLASAGVLRPAAVSAGRDANGAPSRSQYMVAPLWVPPSSPVSTGRADSRLKPAPFDSERAEIEERLRALGANHYRLETWGSDGIYRFLCNVTVDHDPNFSRYFESTDREPIRTMRDVLAQVEAWRAAEPR